MSLLDAIRCRLGCVEHIIQELRNMLDRTNTESPWGIIEEPHIVGMRIFRRRISPTPRNYESPTIIIELAVSDLLIFVDCRPALDPKVELLENRFKLYARLTEQVTDSVNAR